MANEVDISERWLLEVCPKALDALLKDHTTGANIYWASESYAERGEGFGFFDQITVDKIKDDDIIKPRVRKDADEQSRRVKDKAEVFTPAWICNAQNNLVDDAWFGVANVFNTPNEEDGGRTWTSNPITADVFEQAGKTWEEYVNDPRLEITCGEAPYLMNRFDVADPNAGLIPPSERIGMFDRKLRVISAFVKDPLEWILQAKNAIKATYGFEWQGDSLLLAREAMFMTVIEFFLEAFPQYEKRNKNGELKFDRIGIGVNKKGKKSYLLTHLNKCAYYVSWNLWQMDGLKFVLPGTSDLVYDTKKNDGGLFGEEFGDTTDSVKTLAKEVMEARRKGDKSFRPEGIPAVISYWNYKQDKDDKDNAEPIEEAEKDSENKQDDKKRKIFFASLTSK